MPFRSNMFGDKYAQPGTEPGEIDDLLINKYGEVPEMTGAAIDDDGGDSDFKFGGRIQFGELSDDPDTYVEDVQFDGFNSIGDAMSWLVDDLRIDAADIDVDAG